MNKASLDDKRRSTCGAAGHSFGGPGCRASFSRRSFLSGCAACAAAAGLASQPWRSMAQSEGARRTRLRLAFSHTTPDQICWPNIDYDYQGRGDQLLRQLEALCPEVDFLPARILDAEHAKQVFQQDKEVDGYLVYVLGMRGGAAAMTQAAGNAGRPMIVVEDHYAGPFSLGFNEKARNEGWNALCLATSRLEDVASAVRLLDEATRSGQAPADWLSAARKSYLAGLAPKSDMACHEDAAKALDIAECLERLRSSTILLIGKKGGAQAIYDEFGVKTQTADFAELHEAYLNADPQAALQTAERWIADAETIVEPSPEDIRKSAAMALAMNALMEKHNAQAISIHCLGGFYSGQLQAYPCLGFVDLNDEGRVGACEGDLASTVTMLAIGLLAGRPGFISDPVIDTARNRIIYAHCVAPTHVFGSQGPRNPWHIRSHSEDRKGASIRSLLPLGYMTTTLKFLPGQRKALLHQGKSVENIDNPFACRTKLAVEVNGDIDKLFGEWRGGWHRVTFYGDWKQPVAELCQALKIDLVEEA